MTGALAGFLANLLVAVAEAFFILLVAASGLLVMGLLSGVAALSRAAAGHPLALHAPLSLRLLGVLRPLTTSWHC